MSINPSELMPSISNPILQTVDKLKGNNTSMYKKNENGEWKVIPSWIDIDSVASELNSRLKYMSEVRGIFLEGSADRPKDDPENKFEYKQLKKHLRVVNAIRFNGPTAFVSEDQKVSAAYFLTNNLVGDKNAFSYGDRRDDKKDAERQQEHNAVFDGIAVALGHKKTIKRIEHNQKMREFQTQQ